MPLFLLRHHHCAKRLAALIPVLVIGAAIQGTSAGQAPGSGATPAPAATEQALYFASVAAAEATLRLHETAAARLWLERAPERLRGWEWRHLKAQSDESISVIRAHEGPVNGVDVSPDGRWLATASSDRSVRIWNAVSGASARTLVGHTASVWNAKFSPNGARVASTSSDGTLRVWSVATGDLVFNVEGVGRGIAAVAWHPNREEIATTSWDARPGRASGASKVDAAPAIP
jgi:WD40 repeat protein